MNKRALLNDAIMMKLLDSFFILFNSYQLDRSTQQSLCFDNNFAMNHQQKVRLNLKLVWTFVP